MLFRVFSNQGQRLCVVAPIAEIFSNGTVQAELFQTLVFPRLAVVCVGVPCWAEIGNAL
jgi:hypothetical protein